MRLVLLLLLLSLPILAAGCDTMPEEAPGYYVQAELQTHSGGGAS